MSYKIKGQSKILFEIQFLRVRYDVITEVIDKLQDLDYNFFRSEVNRLADLQQEIHNKIHKLEKQIRYGL
jgi:hypothetical protein